MLTTDGHLLGGRVLHRQPAAGFRSGIEPVLLAASIPARSGERVLEAGTGAGTALLCLSARVPGVVAVGVEIDGAMAELAAENARANGFTGIEIIGARIEDAVFDTPFDHAFANPPYHPPGGTTSPVASRHAAKHGSRTMMTGWIGQLAATLRHRGSLTLIVSSGTIDICLEAMAACRCPCTILFPLWPRPGRAAKLVLLRGIKNARSPMRLMPGLVLHDAANAFTETAQAILLEGTALALEA